MWISVELFILKLSSKMCLIENILLKCYIFCYCSIKIFPVKFLISQNKAKFCVRVNQNVQQLRFYKRFPPHVTELWFINFPVRGTCKNVGLHQANFTVWGLKYGSCLCLAEHMQHNKRDPVVLLPSVLSLNVSWLSGLREWTGAEASLYCALPCASPVILCICATVFMFIVNVSV